MSTELVVYEQELIVNPTPRVPIVLCLDTSHSMVGDPIRELENGVNLFYASVRNDEIARYSAEIAIVTFGNQGVQRVADFGSIEGQPELNFVADGNTPMGQAVCEALDSLETAKGNTKRQELTTINRGWYS